MSTGLPGVTTIVRQPRALRRATVVGLVLAASLAGCDTMQRAGGAIFGSSDDKKPAVEAKKPAAVEAGLAPIGGSAAQGSVIFSPRGDGVTMLVQLNGLAPGRYRVLVHANGNCSSPNGFSAGPPWSPPGVTPPLPERIPMITTNSEGSGTLTVRLAGVTIDGPAGVTGRSVVLHDAPNGPFEARPDVANARVACGVIGPLRTFF
jgi:Cu-Zn family superoxide dismutase